LRWQQQPPTVGRAHEGFFYPDPLGFWSEVRRWATIVVGTAEPGVRTVDALSVTALLHLGADATLIRRLLGEVRPSVALFVDEAAWSAFGAGTDTEDAVTITIPDPHRQGVVYTGQWGWRGEVVVGKAPQHPAAHQLYRASDMDRFLQGVPVRAAGAAARSRRN
jgi:hypothetical protein